MHQYQYVYSNLYSHHLTFAANSQIRSSDLTYTPQNQQKKQIKSLPGRAASTLITKKKRKKSKNTVVTRYQVWALSYIKCFQGGQAADLQVAESNYGLGLKKVGICISEEICAAKRN